MIEPSECPQPVDFCLCGRFRLRPEERRFPDVEDIHSREYCGADRRNGGERRAANDRREP